VVDYSIEVSVTEVTTNTARGNLLVELMRDVFDATNHTSGPPIRVTGMEIDTTATHNVTNEKIYAECKAHREPIPADTISKLLGNVLLKKVDQGWLVTTSKLSKDAEGVKEEWEKRPPEERRRLQIYNPPRLLDLLIASNRIFDPAKITATSGTEQGNWYFLLTNLGRYWAKLILEAGVPSRVIVYNAQTGVLVNDAELLKKLKLTDTSLRDFNWPIPSLDGSGVGESPAYLSETVVDVAIGDTWADYRPARPQDFVGRHDLQDTMRDLFLDIRNRSTNTRLFSITGPSGWGKSSLIAKLRDRCGNKANRKKFYMTAFDMRAAKSSNYVSAALLRCFSSAIQQNFILPPVMPLQVGAPTTPLESESLQDCLQQLKDKNKVLILVFDQFEEVLTKPELKQLFDRLRLLALSVDAQKENLVLGFAWKSDAFLPQDHPAYYLWHQLKDRRIDLAVPRFGSKDVSQALTHFQTELGQRLNPVLRSQLVQHCQGFPWLLKKLCIHVLNLVRRDLTQPQVLERGLDVRGLFEADLSGLSSKETLCLKEIARLAPVEWVQIVEQFGNDTYTSLLDKLLIVRSGDRLNPYWDIFGDYLRTNEIPHVPVSFLPGTEIRTLARAAVITIINRPAGVTLEKLSILLSINNRSAGNVVRDLQMFGLAERKGDRIVSTIDIKETRDAIAAIARLIASALNNHIFTIILRRNVAKGSEITEQDLLGFFDEAFRYASLRDVTKRMYTHRLAKYLTATRFLERVRSVWILIGELTGQLILMPRVRGAGEFLGDAPAERVLEVLQKLSKGPVPRAVLNKSRLRNAAACAIMLGLARTHDGIVYRVGDTKDIESSLVGAVTNTRSFKIVSELICKSPDISATEIGKALSEHLDLPWSEASNLRRGNALRKWVRWSQSQTSKRSEPV
jgi:hypothetical protein